jgi:undecaprenyl diphosphate synthase
MQNKNIPNHVAIIMDGNGRWAQSKNKMRTFGHKIGADVIGTIVKAAINKNVKILSLFAFSCEN